MGLGPLHGDQREWYAARVDEKVFPNVQAGIVLSVFVKRPGESKGRATVRYRETYGTRAEKHAAGKQAALEDRAWKKLAPRSPLWIFAPYDVPPEYDSWPRLDQLFPDNVSGVQTHRDQLVVAFTENELRQRLARFADANVPNAHWEEQDVKSTRDWDLSAARQSIRTAAAKNIMRWVFRPFDRRWIAFDDRLIEFTRTNISPHLLNRDDNLAIAFSYGSLTDGPYAFVARTPVPAAVLSWRTFGAAYFAPELIQGPMNHQEWHPNLPEHVVEQLVRARIKTTARGVLEYVYAVLNAPAYRTRFAHGLRYDFARIPFTRSRPLFEKMRKLGAELIALHLLEHPGLERAAPEMDGNDQGVIEQPRYDEAKKTIRLGPELVARPVDPDVWTYQQGAYPVVRKFLEAREGRKLDTLEFDDFRHMAAAVRLTIARLPQLDAALGQIMSGETFTSQDLGFDKTV